MMSFQRSLVPTSLMQIAGLTVILFTALLFFPGRGSFGIIYKGIDLESGMTLAVKVLIINSAKMEQDTRRESELLDQLRHRHIVNCLASEFEQSRAVIVMEFCAGLVPCPLSFPALPDACQNPAMKDFLP